MKEIIVVWLISMDPRNKKKQTTRYHKNDRNPNGIGLVVWREGQTTVGQSSLRRPGDTLNGNRGRPRTRWRDNLDLLAKHWHRIAQNVVQWRSMGLSYVVVSPFLPEFQL